MPRELSAGLDAYLAADASVTGLARAFVITRKDGTVVRLAEVMSDMEIEAHVFSPVTGLKVGSIPYEINPSGPASIDVEFNAYTGGAIAFNDVRDGLYAAATFALYAINRDDPDTELDLLFFGDVGDIKFSNLGFIELTAVGPLGRARDYINDNYQAACRARFTSTGKRGCQVAAASVTFGATVVSVSGRNIVVSGLSNPTGTFNLGLVTLTSGRFNNFKREVRTSTYSAPNTTLELYIPFGVAPEVGVTMTVRQGCSHDLSTTQGCPFYNNIVNYQGEPYLDSDGAAIISQEALGA